MGVVSIPYELSGRRDQKHRTRAALVMAARDLVAGGVTPSVEEVADAASISRATAYRYFPNQRLLLMAAHPEIATRSMLGDNPPEDPAARLDRVVNAFTALIVETEPQQRTMLRLSLESDAATQAALPLRQGRAIAWIAEALEPVREQLTDDGVRALAIAIRSAIGIEALVWLCDIGGLTREQAVASMQWSAQALLQAALAHGAPAHQPPPARRRRK